MSQGSRGRIQQRRLSRKASLHVESLEERRLLSASKAGAMHGAPEQHDRAGEVALAIAGEAVSKYSTLDVSLGAGASLYSNGQGKPAHAASKSTANPSVERYDADLNAQVDAILIPGTRALPSSVLGKGPAIAHQVAPSLKSAVTAAGNSPWTISTSVTASSSDQFSDERSLPSHSSKWVIAGPGLSSQISSGKHLGWSSGKSDAIPDKASSAVRPVSIIASANSVKASISTSVVVVDGKQHTVSVTNPPYQPAWSVATLPKPASNSKPPAANPSGSKVLSTTVKTVEFGDGDRAKIQVVSRSSGASWSIQAKSSSEKPSPPKPEVSKPPQTISLQGPAHQHSSNQQVSKAGQGVLALPMTNSNEGSKNASGGSSSAKSIIASAGTPPVDGGEPSQSVPIRSGNPARIGGVNALAFANEHARELEGSQQAEAAPSEEPPATTPPRHSAVVNHADDAVAPAAQGSQKTTPLDGQSTTDALPLDDESLDSSCGETPTEAAAEANGSWTSAALASTGAVIAEACDVLVDSLPIDAAALDEALAELLGELEDLGNDLASSLAQAGVSPWIAVAAMGAAAGAVHRRRLLRRRAAQAISEREAVLQMFPELLGLVPRGES